MRGKSSTLGAIRWSPNGYQYTRTREGWVLTHRMIAEKQLGRPLKDNERVRFVDGNRKNLDPSNVAVFETKPQGPNRRRAQLEAKIADLQAELESLGGNA